MCVWLFEAQGNGCLHGLAYAYLRRRQSERSDERVLELPKIELPFWCWSFVVNGRWQILLLLTPGPP